MAKPGGGDGRAARDVDPVLDPDGFPWNAGAWFGCLIGGTAWILTGAVASAGAAPRFAAACLGAFAAGNALGWWAWRSRRRIRIFRAAQVLVLVSAGLAAVAAFASGTGGGLLGGGGRAGFGRGDLALLIQLPGLLLLLEFLARARRKGGSSA